jgi:hypothetical protein
MPFGETKEEPGGEQLAHLRELRNRLLHLHKILLDMERQSFERKSGRVTPGELLQLVLNNSQFAWLRMISALVVEIDEVLDEDEAPTSKDFEDLLSQARLLFTSPGNKEFRTNYEAALQQEPSVVMAHSAVMQLLRRVD